MKKNFYLLFALVMLAGCNFNTTSYSNVDATNTVVDLSNADYEVIGTVEGNSEQSYVFGIGGLSQKSLIDNAKADMYRNANLQNNEAIIYPSTTTSVASYAGIYSVVRAHAFGYKIRIKRENSLSSTKTNKEIAEEKVEETLVEPASLSLPLKINDVTASMKDDIMTIALNESCNFNMVRVKADIDFYIGETEVTRYVWNLVMGVNMDKELSELSRKSISNITVEDALTFCKKLNALLSLQIPEGYYFTLPTDAQWELAAKGGDLSNSMIYAGSNQISDVAWYALNTDNEYYIATKNPNQLGIYDMSGGVWEICSQSDNTFQIRGGSFLDSKKLCRVSSKLPCNNETKSKKIGFRLALTKR